MRKLLIALAASISLLGIAGTANAAVSYPPGHMPVSVSGNVSVSIPVSAASHCTVHMYYQYKTITINGRGPWGLSRFRSGPTCGLGSRAAVQHCPGSPCPWSHGGWSSIIGRNSLAQAPAKSTMEWFYIEFRNSHGCWHWTIYPVFNNNPVSHCP